jgi:hypothetical protein
MRRTLIVPLIALLIGTPGLRAASRAPSPTVSLPQQDQNQAPGEGQDQQQPDQGEYQDQNQYPDQGQNVPYESFSPEQLDNLLSPVALYPDPLLAQLLVAATFPDQVEEAARWVRGRGQAGIDAQSWDVSVKAVAHYPSVIEMMADKIDWTTSLGQAYVNQSTDISSSVQRLRHLARNVGNLQSSPQQEVLINADYIAIDPVQPQYIYVPVYDPAICYYRRPYYGPAIVFGVGYPIGTWLNLDFRWGYGGGYGGVFYTGWRHHDGWNGRWMERSRNVVQVNNVYINNRYNNVYVNRTVINRRVNVENINRYNYVHRNVTYNNVEVNNNRRNRGKDFRENDRRNGPDNRGNNGGNNNLNNKMLNRNIDHNNSRYNDFRGRDNNSRRNDRPAEGQQRQGGEPPRPDFQNRTNPQPQPQNRPDVQNRGNGQPQNRPDFQNRGNTQPQSRPDLQNRGNPQIQQQNRATFQGRPQAIQQNQAPHTFGRSEGNFDSRASSQRGQTSREQVSRPAPVARPAPAMRQAPVARPAPAQRAPNQTAPRGGERKRP